MTERAYYKVTNKDGSAILGGTYLGILALAGVMLALPHELAVPVVALLFCGAVAMAWREATR